MFLAAGVVLLPLLAGCATKPTDPDDLETYNETNDPGEPANRAIYKFNDALDTALLHPVAATYRAVAPQKLVRDPIHRVLLNADTPVLFGNDVLQGKPRRAAATLWRFVINSTLGVGGLFDVAASAGVKPHGSDFGETLAVWGLPDGPFVELPLYGPSNPRDAIGIGVDVAMDPLTWLTGPRGIKSAEWGRTGMTAVDRYERSMDSLAAIKKTSLDPYATIRSLYRQNRDSTVATLKAGDQP